MTAPQPNHANSSTTGVLMLPQQPRSRTYSQTSAASGSWWDEKERHEQIVDCQWKGEMELSGKENHWPRKENRTWKADPALEGRNVPYNALKSPSGGRLMNPSTNCSDGDKPL